MGAGIAATARDAGLDVLLHDPDPRRAGASTASTWAPELADLAPCDVVIEAAPERLEVKRALFCALAAVVAPDAVLATNTSSLLVTEIAAGVPGPERVVGLHFFNPVAKMRLVELVAGAASSDAALARARALGEAMGKQVIAAADGPGFLVNRCNRPFSLEALRIVQERLATPEQVDRICRRAAGFRMGPFELMDLVGIDVGYAIARSFYEQTLEPRWRPSPLAARMAAGGRLGRKSGQGWYAYPPGRPADPPAPDPPPRGDGLVVVGGRDASWPTWLLEAAGEAGWDAATPAGGRGRGAVPDRRLRRRRGGPAAAGRPAAAAVRRGAALGPGPGRRPRPGFYLPLPAARRRAGRAVPLPEHRARGGRRGRALLRDARAGAPSGSATARASSVGRILAQLVNEACFALARASGAPPTSTPAWSSGSTTRAGRSRGATGSARARCSTRSWPCGRSTARSATAPRPRSCAPREANLRSTRLTENALPSPA